MRLKNNPTPPGKVVSTSKDKRMALNIPTSSSGSGDRLPIFKFDAKSGDMIAKARVQDETTGAWENEEIEVTYPFRAVVDFENIETGWLAFVNNAPDFVMAKTGTPTPAKPSPEHKFCVRFRMFTKEYGLREFSHTAKTVLRAIDTLHDRYVADSAAQPGKSAVIEITGTETVKIPTPQGELKFKTPKWAIVGWTATPAAFGGAAAEAAPVPKAAPAPVAAPKPAPKPAPVPDEIDEF